MNKVSVSLVLFNHKIEEVKNLILTINGSSVVEKLILVDNSQFAIDYDFSHLSKVRYVLKNENLGYGKAHNIGIKLAVEQNYNYHLVINPDIEIGDNIIENLVNFMDNNKNVGLVMPKIVYGDGSLQYLCKKLPTPFDLIGRRFLPRSIKKMFQARLDGYELKHKDYDKQMDVPNLSGCFMFMRTSVLAQIGGFDERFFMYLEDTDLCRRIGEVSRTVYYPEVSVIHGYAKDSYKSVKLLKFHINSAISYFNKWGWFFDSYRTQKNKNI